MPANWLDNLQKLAGELREDLSRGGRLVLIGADGPTEIDAYRGYGNDHRVLIQGRVMRSQGIGKSSETDGTIRNLLNTYKRVRAHPIPAARIEVSIGGARHEVAADAEGFFRAWVDLPAPIPVTEPWVSAGLRLISPREDSKEVTATARIRIPTPDVTFGVISDLDDTVIQSRVSNFLLAVRTLMLGNARTRLPFPGVMELYRALERGGDGARRNPIYYVSSSPWNIHDLIAEFLELQGIPDGPICLRDWDIEVDALASSRLKRHKEPLIREILDTNPRLSFILIGDTSQRDPEIYREIVHAYPGRILAIYIRNVEPNPERSAAVQELAAEVLKAGSTLVLADDSAAAAKHAVEQGWITADSMPAVQAEKRADEGKTDEKAATPGGGDDEGAPTVVVE
ncbi:MAG TPA: phosphatase domain-containing protein [Gemmatimonadaceae bacterium]|nr:phosphatase domain-containing protein [Gemmatimonadaceae bacterium]